MFNEENQEDTQGGSESAEAEANAAFKSTTGSESSQAQPSLDKEGLKSRVLAASRLSQEDKNILIDLINRS